MVIQVNKELLVAKVIVVISVTSSGPKYWIGPGKMYDSVRAHSPRFLAKNLNGSPFSSTKALRITGFSLPLRRSMFIIMVSGIPPHSQSLAFLVSLRTEDKYPLHLFSANTAAL